VAARPSNPRGAAFAALLYPHAEVVVHELGADRIVALWNPFSGRAVGDPSLAGRSCPRTGGEQPMQGPYPKVELDGRPMSAVSANRAPTRTEPPRGLFVRQPRPLAVRRPSRGSSGALVRADDRGRRRSSSSVTGVTRSLRSVARVLRRGGGVGAVNG